MPIPDLETRILWVRSNNELAAAGRAWEQAPALVIDTEFVRRRTYYPIPALLQFYCGEQIYIVDPVDIDDWEPLAKVLKAPAVIKVLHAAGEDLEVFWRLLRVLPAPLFDTQVAAGLCGLRPSMGYNKLVMALCDVELPKDETQSDWLARPLTESQVHYAAYDVYYLHQVYEQLHARARDMKRLDWVLQDSARLGESLSTKVAPEQAYLRLKAAQRMSTQELAIARDICSWREQRARKQDLPRSWVLKDSTVAGIARRKPANQQELATVKDMQPATLRKQGQKLLDLVAASLATPPAQWPEQLPQPPQAEARDCIKQVQATVDSCAEALSLAPELLMNRKQIGETALRVVAGEADPAPPGIGQWRSEVLDTPLRAIKCR